MENSKGNIVRVLGKGANAYVLLMEDSKDKHLYAAKVYTKDPLSFSDVVRSFYASNALRPYDEILPVKGMEDINTSDFQSAVDSYNDANDFYATKLEDIPYYAAKYDVASMDLDSYLKKAKPSEAERLEIAGQVVCAVRALQENELFHGDLKPGNFLVFMQPRGKVSVKLSDLDTVRSYNDNLKLQSGTEGYSAPEVTYDQKGLLPKINASVGNPAATDIFSLGRTLEKIIPERTDIWGGLVLSDQQERVKQFNLTLEKLGHSCSPSNGSSKISVSKSILNAQLFQKTVILANEYIRNMKTAGYILYRPTKKVLESWIGLSALLAAVRLGEMEKNNHSCTSQSRLTGSDITKVVKASLSTTWNVLFADNLFTFHAFCMNERGNFNAKCLLESFEEGQGLLNLVRPAKNYEPV